MKRDLDRYEPQVLDDLKEAFQFLHTVCYPHLSTGPAGSGRTSAAHPMDQGEADRVYDAVIEADKDGKRFRPWIPDASRAHLRKREKALLEKARRLKDEVLSTAEGGPDLRPPRVRCWNCGEYLKDRARFCSDCGKPKSGKPIPEHPPKDMK